MGAKKKGPAADVDAFDIRLGDETLVVLSMPADGASALDPLTTAEREVARAALQGLSNAEVARARGCSPRTVAVQLASIYRKLGITSRSQLAALVGRGEPGE